MSGSDATAAKGERWTPADLPGCVLWLRADLGVTLVGAGVSLWADQSTTGNDVSQAVAGSRPVMGSLGGQDAILFSGAESLGGSFSGIGADSGLTEFVVARTTDVTPAGSVPLHIMADAVGYGFWVVWYGPLDPTPIPAKSMQLMTLGLPGPTSSHVGYHYDSTTEHHAWTYQHDKYGRCILEDGVGKHSAVFAQPTPALTRHGVGDLPGLFAFGWQGEIAEVITYSRALTLYEIAVVHRYLGLRYGLTVTQ